MLFFKKMKSLFSLHCAQLLAAPDCCFRSAGTVTTNLARGAAAGEIDGVGRAMETSRVEQNRHGLVQ